MKIKVVTKHYIIIKPETAKCPAQVQYDFDEDFIFIYENNIVKIQGSSLKKQANILEDCFKDIKSYFYGSNYAIVDFAKLID